MRARNKKARPGERAGSLESSWSGSATGAADGGANATERRVGVVAEGRNRADADNDNQGQHDGVFNCGRAIFGLHELDVILGELTHGSLQIVGRSLRPQVSL